jgi:hypothetical protein
LLNLLAILFGGLFTLLAAYGTGAAMWRKSGAPPEILLASGAAALSTAVFLLLLCHAAIWPVFLALGVCGIAGLWLRPNQGGTGVSACQPLSRVERWAAGAIFAAYGVFYFFNALAPEIQPDGITYHLGLPFEYVRLGAFPNHARFYDLVPQGIEMLFTMAFAFGQHAAAKLVELGFFAAGAPLIFRIGRRLGTGDSASLLVAAFYWSAPVLGLTGASAYNDAALVFFTLAAFYLLLVWRDVGGTTYLAMAGVLAGFCYAIKFPGLFVGVAAMLFVLTGGKRRLRSAAILLAGMACTVTPWMARAAILTGNPVAPLRNDLFPNPNFNLRTDRELAAGMRSLHGVAVRDVPWELALGDGLSGTYGPLLFFLPLGLLACRSRAGRVCLAGALVLAIPWLSNTAARFLMPAVMVAAFALAMVVPRRAAWLLISVQTLVCWPNLLNTWQAPYTFRLHEFPWRAALGIESQEHYLQNHVAEYNVAKMVERFTAPDARTYSLIPVAAAYLPRDVSVAWQSAEGDRLVGMLRMAAKYREEPLSDWTASWSPASLRALRFRMPADSADEWDIAEVQFYSGGDRIFNSPLWSLRAWPNVWEAPLAFDNRRSTVWRTWQPMRAGMFLEVELDHPQTLSGVSLACHDGEHAPVVYGEDWQGRWRLLAGNLVAQRHLPEDLRLEAISAIRRAGYSYLLAQFGPEGNGQLGGSLFGHSREWGLQVSSTAGTNVLFKLR